MKTAYYLGLIIFIAVFSSCEKDEDPEKIPLDLPETVKFDLNDDSIDDITIDYYRFWSSGLNGPEVVGEGIMGYVEPLNNCLILKEVNGLALFNKLGDVIEKEPFVWYSWEFPIPWDEEPEDGINYSWEVVSIYSSYVDESWPEEWSINSNLDLEYYYMGIRITDETSDQIGWIKLDIDKSTGIIHIVDKRFTTEESIVIED